MAEDNGAELRLLYGQAGDYLERMVGDGFRRELEQEENIVRSLPFFATSLGVLVAFLGLVRLHIPSLSWEADVLVLHGFLGLTLLSLALLLYYLWRAVHSRQFLYPMEEGQLLAYAAELHEYYDDVHRAGEMPQCGRDEVVVAELRNVMLNQMAQAAKFSRANNIRRMRARNRAFTFLLLALSFAFALVVVILFREAINGGFDDDQHVSGPETAGRSGG